MTTWEPDSCDCKIEFLDPIINGNVIWVESFKHCRLHKMLRGQTHLDEVLIHNRSFNSRFPDPTDSEIDVLVTEKETERDRIRNLP